MAATFDEATITWDYVTTSASGAPITNTIPLPWLIRAGGTWTRDGLLIDHVTPGGPATRVTDTRDRIRHVLEAGDTITSVNQIAVLDTGDWVRAMMTAPDPSRIRLTVVRSGAPYDWMIAPQWRASDFLPQPIMLTPSRALSKFAQSAFEDAYREKGADPSRVKAATDRMEQVAREAYRWADAMSDKQRKQILAALPMKTLSTVSSVDAPASLLSRGEEPVALRPPAIPGVHAIPGVPQGPIQPGHLPSPPDITKPETWFPKPADEIETIVNRVGDALTSWGEGVAGGVVETIKQLLAKMPQAIAVAFGTMAAHLDDMFRHLRVITAEGTTLDGAFFAFRDAVLSLCHAVGELVLSVAAVALDLVVNVVTGLVPAIAAARPLTQPEKDFAHAIFHGNINVSQVRLTFHKKAIGLCAANVIWLPSLDLRRMGDRQTFAHELTHVYQDQSPDSPGTGQAAKEFIRHHADGDDVYRLDLRPGTTWEDLGMEQQAELVGLWRTHLDIAKPVPDLEERLHDGIPRAQWPIAAAIMENRSFF